MNVYFEAFSSGAKPLPNYTVSQWADANRILTSKSSAEAGKYKTSRTPYAKEIMDVMSPNAKTANGKPANHVVFIKGSQLGGSETLINCVGYYIDICPCPILYMLSTVDLAKFTSTDRIDPLIEETPAIRSKIGEKRTHNAENSMLKKGFAGGSLRFIGANSPVGMRSAAVRLLIMDEVSSYPQATEEGDPVELARRRADTFGDSKKILEVSTPTIENQCKITRSFEKSDQRYFHVPCPHCDFYQSLIFENLKWEKGKPETVYYQCASCKGKILNDHHKTRLLERGKWIATFPERDVIGFHLSSLYSPKDWKSWEQIIREYEESKDKPELERVFVNTVLGLAYRLKGDSISWEDIFARREKYERNMIPKQGLLLTCGVDVQSDRLELEIVAWGRNKESWSIDYRVLFGDTAREEVWKELNDILEEDFIMEHTGEFRKIQMTCVDSGYNTVHVYNFCRKFSASRVMAIKGQENLPSIHANPKNIDYTYKGKKITNGVRLTMLGVSILKQELYGFLRNNREDDGSFPYGYCHFPYEYSQDYFMMLTAEENIRTINEKKQEKYEWVKIRERNEALDVRNYARAAVALLGYDRMKDEHFQKLEEQFCTNPVVAKNINAQKKQNRRRDLDDDDENNNYWKDRFS